MSSVGAENRIKHLVQIPGSEMLLLHSIWDSTLGSREENPGRSPIFIPGHLARAGVNDRYLGPDLNLPPKPWKLPVCFQWELRE